MLFLETVKLLYIYFLQAKPIFSHKPLIIY